jgi:hypothetical protein
MVLKELYLVEMIVEYSLKANPLQVTSQEKHTRLVLTEDPRMAEILAHKNVSTLTPPHLICNVISTSITETLE